MVDQEKAARILRSRVPQEIREFHQRLQSGGITIEATGSALYQAEGKTVEVTGTTVTKKRGQYYMSKAEQQGGMTRTPDYCYAMNSKYCFELNKNKPRNAWLLSKCVFVTPDFDDTKQGFLLNTGFRSMVDDYISGLTSIQMAQGDVPVDQLSKLPWFELTSASLVGTEQNVLSVNFNYQVIDVKTGNKCRSDCRLEFELGMSCLPTRLHQSYQSGPDEVTHDWRREWVKTDRDSYTVKLAIDTKTVSAAVTKRHIRLRTDAAVSTRDLPESHFTLSAFGFPEPPGVGWKRPFPYYLIVGGVGMLCLGAFFFFRAGARRAGARRAGA